MNFSINNKSTIKPQEQPIVGLVVLGVILMGLSILPLGFEYQQIGLAMTIYILGTVFVGLGVRNFRAFFTALVGPPFVVLFSMAMLWLFVAVFFQALRFFA